MHPSRIQSPVNSEHRTIIGLLDDRIAACRERSNEDAAPDGDGWGGGRGSSLHDGDGVMPSNHHELQKDGNGTGNGASLAW